MIITKWENATGDDAVGAKTIKNRVGTLRLVMKKAKKWGYISVNPCWTWNSQCGIKLSSLISALKMFGASSRKRSIPTISCGG